MASAPPLAATCGGTALRSSLTGRATSALSPLDDGAAYLGLVLFGLALIVRAMRTDWQKPQAPRLVDVDEVAELVSQQHLQDRVRTAFNLMLIAGGIAYLIVKAMQ